jgi:hypothetical protein
MFLPRLGGQIDARRALTNEMQDIGRTVLFLHHFNRGGISDVTRPLDGAFDSLSW